MTTRTASASRLVRAGAALLLLLFTIAACGSDPTPTPTAQPTPTATPEPASTTEPGPAVTTEPEPDTMAPSGWRTDVEVGARHGNRAANASLTLVDGSSATLESVAAGRGVLLYFFATW